MKISRFFFLLVIVLFCTATACPVKSQKGCTDPKALNRDFNADVDDGSCVYSVVTFYASAGFYSGIPITKIDVKVNGNVIGYIPGTFYPTGPGNCSATGTVSYEFQNANKVDWNTTVTLASGTILYGSGQVSPLSSSDCIKVNVTQ